MSLRRHFLLDGPRGSDVETWPAVLRELGWTGVLTGLGYVIAKTIAMVLR